MVIISQVASGMQADIDAFKVCSNPSRSLADWQAGQDAPPTIVAYLKCYTLRRLILRFFISMIV